MTSFGLTLAHLGTFCGGVGQQTGSPSASVVPGAGGGFSEEPAGFHSKETVRTRALSPLWVFFYPSGATQYITKTLCLK